MVSGSAGFLNLLHCLAKEKEVFRSDSLSDLHVGTIKRAYRQCAIHRELHVAGARSLLASCGDLLRQIGSWIDTLAGLDIEVWNEHHPELVVGLVVTIDDIGDRVDQFDDQLRHPVT